MRVSVFSLPDSDFFFFYEKSVIQKFLRLYLESSYYWWLYFTGESSATTGMGMVMFDTICDICTTCYFPDPVHRQNKTKQINKQTKNKQKPPPPPTTTTKKHRTPNPRLG